MSKIIGVFLISVYLLVLSGCGGDDTATSPEQQADEQVTAEQSSSDSDASASNPGNTALVDNLDQLYADYNEDLIELNPVIATFRGIPGYNDRWANSIGSEHLQAERQMHQQYLDRITALLPEEQAPEQLRGNDLLSYQIFVRDRQMALRGMDYPGHLMPVNQFRNPTNFFAQLGSGQNAQPFENEQDYRNFISRANGFAVYIEQAIVNMREGIKQGYTQPKILMQRVLPQLEAHMVEDVSTSIFYRPLENLPETIDAEVRDTLVNDYVAMIEAVLIPSITRLHHFIENEYLPAARDTAGMTALPNGEDWYNYLVEYSTSSDMSPETIHQIGLAEVARIHSEMRKVMQQVDFDGDLKAFFEFTRDDEQFIFDSREAMLEAYRELESTLDAAADKLFSIRPEAGFEVRKVEEYREQSASSGSYQSPAQDGSRPGIFYLNTYDLSARPIWAMSSLFLHEAIPGHHFQLALQQELDELPEFRRFGGTTAYVEGWGLYAESLGKELGVYDDPYQYYGSLVAELWRSIRLVVDTGLHHKGWSREMVLDYMYANAPVAEARAVSEAERFMAIPSQALAYKIGQLKIRELRNHAEQELGDEFDVKAFHSEVLDSGSLPLTILEQKIDRWIAAQQ